MSDNERIELIAELLKTVIANLGYPVGCGLSPHPDTLTKMARHCLAIATHKEDA